MSDIKLTKLSECAGCGANKLNGGNCDALRQSLVS